MKKTVVCLRWGRGCYDSEYVNRLYRAVARNITPPFRFVCFTDNPDGLEPAIEARDAETLTFSPELRHIWWKLAVSHPDAKLSGTCLFLDLDMVIVGNMDGFFNHAPGKFVALRNWINFRKTILRKRPKIFNTSIFRFEAGTQPQVAEMFMKDPQFAQNRKNFSTEQAFMTYAVGAENAEWFPRGLVAHYKYDMRPPFPLNWLIQPTIPNDAKIVLMTGYPKPHEAITEGAKCGWNLHRRILPMLELKNYWY